MISICINSDVVDIESMQKSGSWDLEIGVRVLDCSSVLMGGSWSIRNPNNYV